MDSMDWFDPASEEAEVQIKALNRALKLAGRVLLRSAGLKPWYIPVFERLGFCAKRVGARLPGECVDRYVCGSCVLGGMKGCVTDLAGGVCRVNMYASTWIMTKTHDIVPVTPGVGEKPIASLSASPTLEKLEI